MSETPNFDETRRSRMGTPLDVLEPIIIPPSPFRPPRNVTVDDIKVFSFDNIDVVQLLQSSIATKDVTTCQRILMKVLGAGPTVDLYHTYHLMPPLTACKAVVLMDYYRSLLEFCVENSFSVLKTSRALKLAQEIISKFKSGTRKDFNHSRVLGEIGTILKSNFSSMLSDNSVSFVIRELIAEEIEVPMTQEEITQAQAAEKKAKKAVGKKDPRVELPVTKRQFITREVVREQEADQTFSFSVSECMQINDYFMTSVAQHIRLFQSVFSESRIVSDQGWRRQDGEGGVTVAKVRDRLSRATSTYDFDTHCHAVQSYKFVQRAAPPRPLARAVPEKMWKVRHDKRGAEATEKELRDALVSSEADLRESLSADFEVTRAKIAEQDAELARSDIENALGPGEIVRLKEGVVQLIFNKSKEGDSLLEQRISVLEASVNQSLAADKKGKKT